MCRGLRGIGLTAAVAVAVAVAVVMYTDSCIIILATIVTPATPPLVGPSPGSHLHVEPRYGRGAGDGFQEAVAMRNEVPKSNDEIFMPPSLREGG